MHPITLFQFIVAAGSGIVVVALEIGAVVGVGLILLAPIKAHLPVKRTK